jgi:hypothetical protein
MSRSVSRWAWEHRPALFAAGVWAVALAAVLLYLQVKESPDAYCRRIISIRASLGKNCYEESAEPDLYYVPRSNSPCFPYGSFPDRPHSLHKEPGTMRILALGDSITHNPEFSFVPRGRTYHEVLGNYLNRPGNWTWEILNGGVAGYNTMQEYGYYRSRLRAYAPDLVVLAYVEWNDCDAPPIPEFSTTVEECKWATVPNLMRLPPELHRVLSLRFGAYGFLNRRTYNFLGRFDALRYPPIFFKWSKGREMVEKNRTALLDLIHELSQEGIPLFVLVFPVLNDPYQADPWLRQEPARLIPRGRIAFLADALLTSGSLSSYRDDPNDPIHPIVKAHRIAGQVLCRMIYDFARLNFPVSVQSSDAACGPDVPGD